MPFNHGTNQIVKNAHVNSANGNGNIVNVVVNIEKRREFGNSLLPEGSPTCSAEQTITSSRSLPRNVSPQRSPLKSNNPFRGPFSDAQSSSAPDRISPAATGENQEHEIQKEMADIDVTKANDVLAGPTVNMISTKEANFVPIEDFNKSYSSCKIYVEQMLPHQFGFPLWLPQPDVSLQILHRREGVKIGDLGIITHKGGFEYVLNAWTPRGVPPNPADLPDNSDIIQIPECSIRINTQSLCDPCGAVCSGAFKFNTNYQTRECSFACTENQGAILYMPNGSTGADLKDERSLEEYIVQNAESWYRYVLKTNGKSVERNSLYLVTGWMKSSSWGIATYGVKMPEPYHILKIGPVILPNKKYLWTESSSAMARTGPSPDPDFSIESERENQCLFLQGFKIELSETAWKSIYSSVVTAASPESVNNFSENRPSSASYGSKRNKDSSASPYNSMVSTISGKLALENETHLEQFPVKEKIFHPSDILNKLLLEEVQEARVAVVHDKDWLALLNEGEDIFPSDAILLERAKERLQMEFTEYGTYKGAVWRNAVKHYRSNANKSSQNANDHIIKFFQSTADDKISAAGSSIPSFASNEPISSSGDEQARQLKFGKIFIEPESMEELQ
ncbi:hypothetical protein BDQ12DRAFT_724216 [Crucibulum laeve]|uniref:Uncharacterized protein n=1 Tax=Crucibulum laeve TaxID=68775 RepID=A0A5C3LXE6_9AGAR|nr:hypothetical protein BDQ12DRAFT_724216 [Crucibulum laeve]